MIYESRVMNMRNNTYILYVKAMLAALLLSPILLACSEDEGGGPSEEDGKLYTLTIALNASSNYTPVTKADPPAWADGADVYERKIDKCWVVLFNDQNTCVASVNTNQFIENGSTVDNAQEVSSTTVELPVGNYTGYAFANLDNLDANSMDIISLLEGDDLTQITKEKLNTTVSLIDAENFTLADGGKAIPMSSYETDITVQANTENTARIVLFRMIGKVEITITDQTGNDETKTLRSLSMGNFRNGPIYLLPYTEGEITLNNISMADHELLHPKFPADATVSPYTKSIIAQDDEAEIINQTNGNTYTFYAFETGTKSNTDGALSISVGINNRPVSTRTTEFSFMRRNDWLKIPAVITNIESRIRFKNMRMPIGGLPYEVVYGEGNGIQILVDAVNEVDPDYTGPVKIEVEVKSINTSVTDLDILYTGTTAEGSDRSTAVLTDNSDNLLINKDSGEPISNGTSFTVTALPDESDNTKKAYFEVWTQELANNSDATITLTLIAEYGDTEPKSRIEIPYTIRMQNYERTTTEGGN